MQFAIANLRRFQQELENADKARIKAGQTAVKVEGFRLMKLLKQQIRAGAPAGRPFSPLSEIAKTRRRGQAKNRRALYRLAIPVRYRVNTDDKGMDFEFGYLVRDIAKTWNRKTKTGIRSKNRISKSWAYLAQLHQEGGQIPISAEARAYLAMVGGQLKTKGTPAAKYFFLKPSTKYFTIPPRPIIEPFWRANRREARRRIMTNFERKMRGERI